MGLTVRLNETPHKTFLHLEGEQLTFAEVSGLVAATCAHIQAQRALERGDRVAILMPSGLGFILAVLALLRMRVIAVPLNARLTAGELKWQLKNADCRLLIADAVTSQMARALGVDVLELPVMRADGAPADQGDYGTLDLDDDCAIIHTSGTTGKPKAAVLTGGNIYHSAMASALRLGCMQQERWLCVLPLYHVGGLSIVLRSLFYGTAVDLMGFDVAAVNRALSTRPITIVSLVPTMLGRLLDAKTGPWNSQLRLILLGGEAPTEALLARCAEAELPIATSYGLSEAASQVATALPELVSNKPGSVGKPLAFTQLRISDAQGRDAPRNVPGEISVKGLTVLREYYRDERATADALRAGWLHTGDIGYLDEDGDLFILQRRADLIVSGGENVYPAEIETVLRRHPAVKEVLVFGLSDAEWGQRVTALIKCHDDALPSAQELDAFARERLAGYKIPRQLAFVDELPRTASGKIKRGEARKAFEYAISSRN